MLEFCNYCPPRERVLNIRVLLQSIDTTPLCTNWCRSPTQLYYWFQTALQCISFCWTVPTWPSYCSRLRSVLLMQSRDTEMST